MSDKTKISDWIENRLANGQYSFSLEFLQKDLIHKTKISINRGLSRLVKQGKIISIFKGFYIIVPPSYRNMKMLPPIMFIDDLMAFLGRPYYVSLLSAAAIHGAAHQQPQSHYICTVMPSLRTTLKNGISIRYISKRNFSEKHIIKKKTETGYVNVSNPLLTCIDLIKNNKVVGGWNRAATMINELSEEINPSNLNSNLIDDAAISDLQRLGYIWEYIVDQNELANHLHTVLLKSVIRLRTYKLINTKSKNQNNQKNRWNINVNMKIEIDE